MIFYAWLIDFFPEILGHLFLYLVHVLMKIFENWSVSPFIFETSFWAYRHRIRAPMPSIFFPCSKHTCRKSKNFCTNFQSVQLIKYNHKKKRKKFTQHFKQKNNLGEKGEKHWKLFRKPFFFVNFANIYLLLLPFFIDIQMGGFCKFCRWTMQQISKYETMSLPGPLRSSAFVHTYGSSYPRVCAQIPSRRSSRATTYFLELIICVDFFRWRK